MSGSRARYHRPRDAEALGSQRRAQRREYAEHLIWVAVRSFLTAQRIATDRRVWLLPCRSGPPVQFTERGHWGQFKPFALGPSQGGRIPPCHSHSP
jgi:hypothetical protein